MEQLLYDIRREQYKQVQELATNGAKLLDRVEPDWFRSINLNTLSISSAFNCILGQLYRGFYAGSMEISDAIPGWHERWEDNLDLLAYHGFTAYRAGGITGSRDHDLELLGYAWIDEIKERLRERA